MKRYLLYSCLLAHGSPAAVFWMKIRNRLSPLRIFTVRPPMPKRPLMRLTTCSIMWDRIIAIPLNGERATKGAAAGLLAKVYLTRQEWALAAQKAKEVIDMGVYDLWSIYAQVFDIANENGPESVFTIQQVSGGVGQGSNYMTFFARENSPITGQGWGSFSLPEK